jgi:hypothetical protein
VNHAETIILGGLIKSADGKSQTKIPILGDIPILGRLFTSKGDSGSKVNVVIYITPYIIKKSSDLTTLRTHLDELESIQQQYNKIVFDRLEAKTGHRKDRKHTTFNGSSSYDNSFSDDAESDEILLPPVERTTPVNASEYEVYEPTTEVAPLPVESYTAESDYVRSESIMDTINNKAEVNLNRINTGIEYNEGTTFSNTDQY